MKQAEWRDRCNREHEQGGEVIGVTLVPRSAQELACEVLCSPEAVTVTHDDDGLPEGKRRVVAGGRIGSMLNPATDVWIEAGIDPGAEADTVTVRDADGSVRTIAFALA